MRPGCLVFPSGVQSEGDFSWVTLLAGWFCATLFQPPITSL